MSSSSSTAETKIDYTEVVDTEIPKNKELAGQGSIQEAIDNLFALEKKTRMSDDSVNTSKLVLAIAQICFEAKDWKLLNDNLTLISKRRGQLKKALTAVVQEAVTYLDQTPDEETKFELIDTLRLVTAGKIHVENERARLTKMVVDKKEAEGELEEAATMLQEVQVETYGSMERKEKTMFILEQMRLTLAVKDYIRTQILSKKIAKSVFDGEDFQEEKLVYYGYMVRYYAHSKEYLEICRCYMEMYNTALVKDDKEERAKILKLVVSYLVLTPHGNERNDLLHRLQKDKYVEEIPAYFQLLQLFTTNELMRWPTMDEKYHDEFFSQEAFQDSVEDKQESRYGDFNNRVVEHNIRVVAQYYSRIRMTRLAQLLDLDQDEAEKHLSEEIVKKNVNGKIDRLAGIVTFDLSKKAGDVLHDWSSDISQLLAQVEKTCHLIHKEHMLHKMGKK